MTEGRFESTYHTRGDFDQRTHWTKSQRHPMDCQEDHMQRESCPYHDLRADGCFQPEHGGAGPFVGKAASGAMTSRDHGGRFRTHGGGQRGRAEGLGGSAILFEVQPAPPPAGIKRDARPWANSSGADRGTFGKFPHVAEPAPETARPVAGAHFRAGGKPALIGGVLPHVPAAYGPKASPRNFRLATGKATESAFLPLVSVRPKKPEQLVTTPRKTFRRREPFHDTRSVQGTFGHYPGYASDPIPTTQIRKHKLALFTYAAKSKRTMPLAAPWSAAPQGTATCIRSQ